MTTANIFLQASRLKLRFPSSKGELTTEQLWDLPLSSKTGFDLDSVARAVYSQMNAVAEPSFVAVRSNPLKDKLELSLEIVKHVIATKMAENEVANKRAAAKAERDRLTAILADKQDADLRSLSADEIKRRLIELDVEAS